MLTGRVELRRLHLPERLDDAAPLAAVPGLRGAGPHEGPVQPRVEPLGVSQRPHVAPCTEECLLHGVPRQVAVAQDPIRHAVEPIGRVVHECRERIVVAALGALDAGPPGRAIDPGLGLRPAGSDRSAPAHSRAMALLATAPAALVAAASPAVALVCE